jgi:hypothetical protein
MNVLLKTLYKGNGRANIEKDEKTVQIAIAATSQSCAFCYVQALKNNKQCLANTMMQEEKNIFFLLKIIYYIPNESCLILNSTNNRWQHCLY